MKEEMMEDAMDDAFADDEDEDEVLRLSFRITKLSCTHAHTGFARTCSRVRSFARALPRPTGGGSARLSLC